MILLRGADSVLGEPVHHEDSGRYEKDDDNLKAAHQRGLAPLISWMFTPKSPVAKLSGR
jgi:hypothetical protein